MRPEHWKLAGLAAFSFLSGLAKSRVVATHNAKGSCDLTLLMAKEQMVLDAPESCFVAPIKEEIIFRQVAQSLVGLPIASVAFGLSHGSSCDSPGMNVFKKVDATIGGVIYGTAFNIAGIGASTICHALHNIGARVGAVGAINQEMKRRNGR